MVGSSEKPRRKFRCKTKSGYSCMWTIGRQKDGVWRIVSLGSVKLGGKSIPLDFVPFELSNLILGHNKPSFSSGDDCEAYVRAL